MRGETDGACHANDLKVINIDVAEKVSMVPFDDDATPSSGGYDKGMLSMDPVCAATDNACLAARPGDVCECPIVVTDEVDADGDADTV